MKNYFLFTLFVVSVSLISCQQSAILDEIPATNQETILPNDDVYRVELRSRQQLGVNSL